MLETRHFTESSGTYTVRTVPNGLHRDHDGDIPCGNHYIESDPIRINVNAFIVVRALHTGDAGYSGAHAVVHGLGDELCDHGMRMLHNATGEAQYAIHHLNINWERYKLRGYLWHHQSRWKCVGAE